MRNHWALLLVCLFTFFAATHGNCTVPINPIYAQLSDQYAEQKEFPINSTVSFVCRPGFLPIPGIKNTITCLSDSTWTTLESFCRRRPCPSLPDVLNGDFKSNDDELLFGSIVTYTCHTGYKLESKTANITCLADGTWSNIPPTCAIQECPPPSAIVDGTFEPNQDDYVYLNAVTYSCKKDLTLIGERSMHCTANGNWSSDPPQCKAVECLDPEVPNSSRLSGFIGPYPPNSAIRFECNKGYTMIGSDLITCRASSTWVPAPPTCKSMVTQKPTTEKAKPGSTTTLKPATTKKIDTETHDSGNHVGAVVGGVIAGIVAVTAVAVFIWWCKTKSGKPYSDPNGVGYGTCDK